MQYARMKKRINCRLASRVSSSLSLRRSIKSVGLSLSASILIVCNPPRVEESTRTFNSASRK
jgi:hypothetical protein